MVQFTTLGTDAVLAAVLPAGSPLGDVHNEMAAAHSAAWGAVDPVLLELCRVRIAMLLGCEAEVLARTPEAIAAGLDEQSLVALSNWPTSELFGERERAVLAFTEHYLLDVASLPDETAVAVRDQLGDAGLQNFVSALLIVEQRIRLRLTWNRLFGGT
jgi:alkylhydroperoxidase family enzyme